MDLPIRPPVIVHHQAALDEGETRVPNSLEAIAACLDAHAEFVEIDVTALRDADYLLVHDPLLEAETSGDGPVAECSAADARRLKFRCSSESAVSVPLLSDVVALFAQRASDTRLQLDFKNTRPFPDDEPLQRLAQLLEPLGSRALVSTNADWQLRKLRRIAPWLDLGLDIHFYLDWQEPDRARAPETYPRQYGAHGYWDDHPLAREKFWSAADYLGDRCASLVGLVPGVSTFYVSYRLLRRSLDDGFNWAAALHAQGIKLDAWTMDVTSRGAMSALQRLYDAGVDQFTTNTPRALAAALG